MEGFTTKYRENAKIRILIPLLHLHLHEMEHWFYRLTKSSSYK